jgi:hypothetical protein
MKERELVKYMTMLVLLGCGMPASAEIYQWIDSSGRTHYGDAAAKAAQPGRQADKLNIKETAEAIDPDAERNRQQLRMLHDQNNQQRAAQAQKAAQLQEQHQQQQQRCKSLQNTIRSEQRAGVMFSYDEAGNRVIWSAEQRTTYREQLQAANQQYCADN